LVNCNRIVSEDQINSSNEKCSVTAKACEFYQRNDDKPEVIGKRIQVYQEQTTPVIEYYKPNSNFLTVDGTLPADQVFQIILKILK